MTNNEIDYRVWMALMSLAQAGETSDPHIQRESYIDALWRFRTVVEDNLDG